MQDGVSNDEVRGFISHKLNDMYDNFPDFRIDIEKITLPKKPFVYKSQLLSEKIVAFSYSSMIKFCRSGKTKGIPMSKIFIGNIVNILKNTHCIHHSRIHSPAKRQETIIIKYQLSLTICLDLIFSFL